MSIDEIRQREIAKRLKHVIDRVGGVCHAARLLDVNRGTLLKWLKGQARVPFDAATTLTLEAGYSLDWLATGGGPLGRSSQIASRRALTTVCRQAAICYAADPQFGIACLIEGLCRRAGLSLPDAMKVRDAFFKAAQAAIDNRTSINPLNLRSGEQERLAS